MVIYKNRVDIPLDVQSGPFIHGSAHSWIISFMFKSTVIKYLVSFINKILKLLIEYLRLSWFWCFIQWTLEEKVSL